MLLKLQMKLTKSTFDYQINQPDFVTDDYKIVF